MKHCRNDEAKCKGGYKTDSLTFQVSCFQLVIGRGWLYTTCLIIVESGHSKIEAIPIKPVAAKTLMIQGTCSDAGKTILVAGLCRLLKRKGIKVVPFKPQNMANNSAVTVQGGEIGRAQAVQAQAAGVEPHIDMNPVLLKPSTDTGAQVVIHGQAQQVMDARSYHAFKPQAMKYVLQSYQRLAEEYDVVIVEGAGSPAEINLRDGDIANMGFAEAVNCPVILVGDIDRGGVFAQLIGTQDLLSESEQRRIKGFIINKFRGDVSLLDSGIDWLQARSQKPLIGVMPFIEGLHLEAEDSLSLNRTQAVSSAAQKLKVVVPKLPRISNPTDLDALRLHPQVELNIVAAGQTIPDTDLIILPGSKSVMTDLQWLQQHGWDKAIKRHLRYGGKVLGICGGYQMLGEWIYDPHGVESNTPQMPGLGLLDITTTLKESKQLKRVSGELLFADVQVQGYEIHMGQTEGNATQKPLIRMQGSFDGARSDDDQVMGTYLHGLFDASHACQALLLWAGLEQPQPFDYFMHCENEIDRLADNMQQHLDVEQLLGWVL